MGGAGVCHSDLHITHERAPENMPELAHIDSDFTLGHENGGFIEALGSGVSGWDVGQPVIVSPVWACRRCAACRSGDDAYCEGPTMLSGGLGRDGGLGGGTFPLSYGALPVAATIGYTFGGSLIDLAEVVALAESGRVRPHVQHFAFDEIEQAYHDLHEGKVMGLILASVAVESVLSGMKLYFSI